jgi:hypothetical protein
MSSSKGMKNVSSLNLLLYELLINLQNGLKSARSVFEDVLNENIQQPATPPKEYTNPILMELNYVGSALIRSLHLID